MTNYINGRYTEITDEEIALAQKVAKKHLSEIHGQSYDELVDAEIRKRYSISQEFAILRQSAEKPEEYERYYAYCEKCKEIIKETIRGGMNYDS